MAALVGQRAAVGEDAAGKLSAEGRQEAGNRVEPAVVLADASTRDAAQQADRVRMARVLEDRLDRAFLDEAPGVEHAHAVEHIFEMTPRLWLMKRTAVSSSDWSWLTRSSTSASTVASSPVVGSSRISSSGFLASAMAITTRCCMPPESWCG